MKVTKEFLMQHRTDNGGWSRVQLGVLGITYPPHRGWMNRVVGRRLTPAEVQQFIDGRELTGLRGGGTQPRVVRT